MAYGRFRQPFLSLRLPSSKNPLSPESFSRTSDVNFVFRYPILEILHLFSLSFLGRLAIAKSLM